MQNCMALPSCALGEIGVATCPKGATCHEVELCGNTILCTQDAPCAAAPACGPGELLVTSCPQKTCKTVTACSTTILCAPSGGACTTSADCLSSEYCSFRDGRCGAGIAGTCAPRPMFCSDGPSVCFCDGTVSGLNGLPCAGLNGSDFDSTGACTIPATAFHCGHSVCDLGTKDFCRQTPDDTGGAPIVECNIAPTGCDPASCACLTAETTACSGTCVDGSNGPTITCPGG